METNRAKILQVMQQYGVITKRIAARRELSYGLADHILHLRRRFNIETHMMVNSKTGTRYAIYQYRGKK